MVSEGIHTDTLRDEFPLLHQEVNGHPLVYFDNAATSQKPMSVIESISRYYTDYNANIHRGVHHLANVATNAYESSREKIAQFIHARSQREIIFTSGTTDAINLVAQTWGRKFLQKGDAILVSMLEHHSNIVPWQMLAEEKGLELRVIPILENGNWDLEAIPALLTNEVKLVSVNHVSNALGIINPVSHLISLAHKHGAKVLIDGAQSVAHFAVNVQELDCDFYCFSGHKMYGPTGIGVLYGKEELLNEMPPWRGGGEMIKNVSFSGTTYNELPYKFEAGTPHIEGVIALGAAVDFINNLSWDDLQSHDASLLHYCTNALKEIPGMRIFGDVEEKVGVISFLVEGVHPYDLGTLLDKQGIAVRTGHHCTQPLWDHFGVSGSVRISFAAYNTKEEVDLLLIALEKALNILR